MISRRTFAALTLALSAAVALPALASTRYTPAALAEAQAAGKPILVEISAPWCPTCRAQKVVLQDLEMDDRFQNFVKLEVDFDSQKSDVRALKASRQSTLIVYKGKTEVGRAVGITSKEQIAALLAKAL